MEYYKKATKKILGLDIGTHFLLMNLVHFNLLTFFHVL